MWYKVRELCSKGLNKTQIGRCLGVDRSTVRRYLAISREEFIRKQNSHRRHKLKLGKYEEYVAEPWKNIRIYLLPGYMTGSGNVIQTSLKYAARPYLTLSDA